MASTTGYDSVTSYIAARLPEIEIADDQDTNLCTETCRNRVPRGRSYWILPWPMDSSDDYLVRSCVPLLLF